jgi:GAF domain-containing protein
MGAARGWEFRGSSSAARRRRLKRKHREVVWNGVLSSKSASAEAILVVERRILEMVARGDSLAEILDSLCRFAEEQASGVLASISLLDGDRLWRGAAPSLPKAYTDAINGMAIGPSAGSCGTAAYRGQPVIVEDIASDPLWSTYCDLALSHSLRACWSIPVSSRAAPADRVRSKVR